MLFNSFIFLLVFTPILLISLSISNLRKDYILIFFSLFFYIYSGVSNLILLIAEILWVYFCTKNKFLKKNILFSIGVLLLILIFFKYYNQFFLIFSNEGFLGKVIMPIGISFFTFQMISYLVDSKKEKGKTLELKELFCFITFFPQLVSGPIVRVSQIINPLKKINKYVLTYNKLKNAICLFLIGLSIKVLLADNLAKLSSLSNNSLINISYHEFIFIILSFSIQIYLDFFGYTICAIGLGKLFGLRLPQNFKSPYKSLNPVDFWRRWHITLSNWLRDYVYIPLGGNKKYTKNIFIVFFICGVWHGSELSFVFWGIYHFMLIMTYKKISLYWDRLNVKLQISLNFLLVSLGWIFFKFSIEEIINMNVVFSINLFYSPEMIYKFLALFLFIYITFSINLFRVYFNLAKIKNKYSLPIIYGLIIFVNLIFIVEGQKFIYFIF